MRNVEAAKSRICPSCCKASADWIRDFNSSSSNHGINGQSGLSSVPEKVDDNVEVPDVCDTVVARYDGKELWCSESYLAVEAYEVVELLSKPYPRSPHNQCLSGYVYAKSEGGRVGWLPQVVLANQPFYKPPPPTTPPPPVNVPFEVQGIENMS